MSNNIKKFCLILMLFLLPFLVTGCSSNGSPEDVAVNMVRRLSNDNYKDIESIFYQDENSYFDEEAFKSIVKEKGLNISGNKKVEVKEVSDEVTNSDGNSVVTVQISIDNNKLFTIDTIKVDNKWYVWEPDFYDGDIVIAVPKGAQVKFNNKKLSNKYLETKNIDVEIEYDLELSDVTMDVYTIQNLIGGKYSVSISGKNLRTVKDVVYTVNKRSSSTDSDNYVYDSDYYEDISKYTFCMTTDDDKVESFVQDYLNNIYLNAVNTQSFDGISKYFDESSSDFNTIKSNYESLISKIGTPQDRSYLNNFEVKNLEYVSNYYLDDNNFIVEIKYQLNYKSNYSSSNNVYDKNTTVNTTLIMKKKSDGSLVITDGERFFAK